jgi:hypothetical protein
MNAIDRPEKSRTFSLFLRENNSYLLIEIYKIPDILKNKKF